MILRSPKFPYARLMAVVLLVAAVAVAVKPPVASADNAEIASDVFSMQNLTPYPLVTLGSQTKLGVYGGASWSQSWGNSYPYPGQVIQPGQTVYYDNARYYLGPSNTKGYPNAAWIEYTIGYGGPELTYSMWNNGLGNGTLFHADTIGCTSADAAWKCDAGIVGQNQGGAAKIYSATQQTSPVTATEPAPAQTGSDLPLQLYLLQTLCQKDLATSCKLIDTATKSTQYSMPAGIVGDELFNYITGTDEKGKHTVSKGWEMGTSYEVGGKVTPLDVDIAGVVKAAVSTSFGHEWGTTNALDIENGVFVPPDWYGYITADVTSDELTGTWQVTVGNNTYTLQNATLTNPVEMTSGNDTGFSWENTAKAFQMTPCQLASAPPTPGSSSNGAPPTTAPASAPGNEDPLSCTPPSSTSTTTTR
jgi:hypothetical protein